MKKFNKFEANLKEYIAKKIALRGRGMKKLYIVGGNGFARECYSYLIKLDEYGKEVIFKGFLGHNGYGHTVDYKELQSLYLGEISEHKIQKDDYFIIGAGYAKLRKVIYEDLKKMGVKFYTLIAKGVHLSPSFKYGEANAFVAPFYPSINIEVGNANLFNGGGIVVGHDSIIGSFNFFGPACTILGDVKIGDSNTIAVGSILLEHSKIGNHNNITPASVVYKGCKDNCYMHGNPAVNIGKKN